MVLLHNFCILVIISLPFMFSGMSSTESLFFGVPEFDNCGGCFVTLEAYIAEFIFPLHLNFPCCIEETGKVDF